MPSTLPSAIIWGTVCLCRHTLQNDLIGPGLGSALCGLSVLIESPSRRAELACYVMPRALQTAWALLTWKRGYTAIPHAEQALLCAAVAVVMVYYCRPSVPDLTRHGGPRTTHGGTRTHTGSGRDGDEAGSADGECGAGDSEGAGGCARAPVEVPAWRRDMLKPAFRALLRLFMGHESAYQLSCTRAQGRAAGLDA